MRASKALDHGIRLRSAVPLRAPHVPADEKTRILGAFEVGKPLERALMRRDGVYSPQLSNWRKQLASGPLAKRGRPANPEAAGECSA